MKIITQHPVKSGITAAIMAVVLVGAMIAFPYEARAAIAVDATSSTQGTSDPQTLSHTTSGTDVVLTVCVARSTNSAPSGVTFNGDALTKQVEHGTGLGNLNVSLWSIVGPDIGTYDISVSGGATKAIGAISFTGANAIGGTAGAFATGTNTLSATPTVTGSAGIVVDCAYWQKSPQTIGSGQTEYASESNWYNDGGDLADMKGSYESHSGSNVTMSWTSGVSQTKRIVAMEVIEGEQAAPATGNPGAAAAAGFTF